MNTAHGEGARYGICLSLLAGCCVLSCESIAAPLPSSPSPSCQRLRQILRNLPAVRATVARPPCRLSVHRRQPFDVCQPAQREQPCKPSARFGHTSQGRLLRDRVGAFPFGYALAPVSRGKPSAFARSFKGRGKPCGGACRIAPQTPKNQNCNL